MHLWLPLENEEFSHCPPGGSPVLGLGREFLSVHKKLVLQWLEMAF